MRAATQALPSRDRQGAVTAIRALLALTLGLAATAAEYKDGYSDSNGVKIHYVTTGIGPLLVMIHGFPDFWYTWRHQMEALSGQYQVAAIDLRGYNLSDKPAGEENYEMRLIIGDVAAVIKHLGREKANSAYARRFQSPDSHKALTALLVPALNNTWDWLDADLTLVTIPNASHFVQQDAAELVSKSMKSWLNR